LPKDFVAYAHSKCLPKDDECMEEGEKMKIQHLTLMAGMHDYRPFPN
jgi:hypothetical protein